MSDRERRAREAVQKIAREARRSLSKGGNRIWWRQQIRTQPVEWLVEAAREGDPDAIDLLREYGRGARKAGTSAPHELHAFVWDYFLNGPPKVPPGAKVPDRLLRNMIIVALVGIVTDDMGFPATRNRAGGTISACKIVAEELGALNLTEAAVEAIWKAGKQDRRRKNSS